jgi:penicillin-binding protein 1A
MGWGRKKRGGRKEPVFSGFAASLAELRLNPLDRVTVAEDAPAKRATPRKATGANGGSHKPSPDRSSKGRTKKRRRARLSRVFYWGAVLSLWAAIAVIGVVVYVGAHLPPIQSLEIPKRPPTIQIVGADGSVLATRGEMAGITALIRSASCERPLQTLCTGAYRKAVRP